MRVRFAATLLWHHFLPGNVMTINTYSGSYLVPLWVLRAVTQFSHSRGGIMYVFCCFFMAIRALSLAVWQLSEGGTACPCNANHGCNPNGDHEDEKANQRGFFAAGNSVRAISPLGRGDTGRRGGGRSLRHVHTSSPSRPRRRRRRREMSTAPGESCRTLFIFLGLPYTHGDSEPLLSGFP